MQSEFYRETTQSKAALRRKLLKARQSMPLDVWRQKSDRLCTHLQTWPLFAHSRTILAYLSFRQEPDLSLLFNPSLGKRWGFPRCEGNSLIWHACSPRDENTLQLGAYGIPEPKPDLPVLMAEQVDLILVPAIACDAQGHRLGYGGGFYDRWLSSPGWCSKPTVGIVFESARLAALPTDPWDCSVQVVCTEAGLFKSVCSGSKFF